MKPTFKQLFNRYENDSQSSQDAFLKPDEIQLNAYFEELLAWKDSSAARFFYDLLLQSEEENQYLYLIHHLLLEPWHTLYEEIAHELQRRKDVRSVPVLREAMQQRFEYLESYGTGSPQFINQCAHALLSIGTKQAIDVIYELSQSEDEMLKEVMLYRISKLM